MGAGDDPIYVHVGPSQVDGVAALREAIKTTGALFAIVDPMLRFIRVEDGNAYAEMTTKLEPVISLARETRCHIVLVHHTSKGHKRGPDAILGSTAILGAVDTAVMLLEGKGGRRQWETVQRYGENIPPTYLYFDVDKGVVSSDQVDNKIVPEITDVTEAKDKKKEILEYLGDNTQSEKQIRTGVRGDTGLIGASLRQLVKVREILRTGKGVPGDPY